MVHNWAQILLVRVMGAGRNNKSVNCSSAYLTDRSTSKHLILRIGPPAILSVSGFLLLIQFYTVHCFVTKCGRYLLALALVTNTKSSSQRTLRFCTDTFNDTSVEWTAIHWCTHSPPVLWTFVINKLVLLRKKYFDTSHMQVENW